MTFGPVRDDLAHAAARPGSSIRTSMPGSGWPTEPGIDLVAGPRHRQHRRRLGQAVALVEVEAEAAERLHACRAAAPSRREMSRRSRPPSLRCTGPEQELAQVPTSHGSLSRSERLSSTSEIERLLDQHARRRDVLVDLALEQLPQRRHADHAGDAARPRARAPSASASISSR